MKIGVIADTHISDKTQEIPKKILDAFKGMDMVIHAGDILDQSALDALSCVCKKVIAVCGNMDPAEMRRKLKEKEIIQAGKKKIGLFHGRGAPNRLLELLEIEFRNDKVDIVVFGHSHTPTHEMKNGILYFNPGSPTDKVFAPYNSYGIIEISDTIKARIIKL